MSQTQKEYVEEAYEFKWGKKRGVGGKKKEVQFYESFTYDGEKYSLYDAVYLYKEGEPEPYIGKLVKIWEQLQKKKKVKVLWFFRPDEIFNYLEDSTHLENEVFLASGDGLGLANINPLEAIAGKCHVVCTSKDSRNPQPSLEELKMADYIFYRTFNVGSYTISDKIDDNIAGVEVRFLYNREGGQPSSAVPKLCVDNGNVMDSNEVSELCPKSNSQETVVSDLGADSKELKFSNDLGVLDDKPSKKARLDSSFKLPEEPATSHPLTLKKDKNGNIIQKKQGSDKDDNGAQQTSGASDISIDDKTNSNPFKDPLRLEKGSAKKVKFEEKASKLSNGTRIKAAVVHASEKNLVPEGQELEVTRRPDTDRSKWFEPLPWEERLQTAHKHGTLVLLDNLAPEYSSTEIEDIVWSGFRESCTAKVVPRTSNSSPHSGQAFVIFKTRDAADTAVRKLDEGCLMLPNGRPLVASWGTPPSLSGKPSTFIGHLVIDNYKFQAHREDHRSAISTSHCSQPNTIEYEMAMEWCLLQLRTDNMLKELYKQHGNELKKLKAGLKSK